MGISLRGEVVIDRDEGDEGKERGGKRDEERGREVGGVVAGETWSSCCRRKVGHSRLLQCYFTPDLLLRPDHQLISLCA